MGAHQLTILRDGEQTFPSMLRAIAAARSFVCLETYIYQDDRTGRMFAEALVERARAGVEVNLLVDAWGSPLPSVFLRSLEKGGVRVVLYNPLRFLTSGPFRSRLAKLWRRDHRKILVVDGEVGFTGGLNIGDDYASAAVGGGGWRDTHLRIEGPAVKELLYLFLRTWRRQKGPPLDEGRYVIEGRRPDPKVHILGNDLRRGRRMIKEAYLQTIRRAKDRIWITSAYFMPTRSLIRALKLAARRGVDVRLLLAGTTDIPAARYGAQAFYPGLLKAGVRIYEWQGRVLHAKTAQADGKWVTVGSTNLDTLSLRLNLEVNAVVRDRRFADAMDRMFEDDLEHCIEVEWRWFRYRPLLDRLLSFILGRLHRWL